MLSSPIERIGNELGIKHLKDVISETNLFLTAGWPTQIIPKFLYGFISLFVNDLRPRNFNYRKKKSKIRKKKI